VQGAETVHAGGDSPTAFESMGDNQLLPPYVRPFKASPASCIGVQVLGPGSCRVAPRGVPTRKATLQLVHTPTSSTQGGHFRVPLCMCVVRLNCASALSEIRHWNLCLLSTRGDLEETMTKND
jgi:hypothetical protein